MKILVLNGPNLNMLGYGEGALAGEMTLTELDRAVAAYGEETSQGLKLVFYQTNHEGQLIDVLQRASQQYDGVLLNPASYGSYSLALRDAVQLAAVPVVEVQLSGLSGLFAQGESVIAPACAARFVGAGEQPYKEALSFLTALVGAQ